MRKILAAAAGLVLCFANTGAFAVKLPVESFAALPMINVVRLSPDGKKLAMMVNNEGTTTILVQDVGGGAPKRVALASTDNREYSFQWIHWVSNERLLLGTEFPSKRRNNSVGNVGGIATHETRLLMAAADGSGVVNLMKPKSFSGEYQPQFQDRVADYLPEDGKSVLLLLADPNVGPQPAVVRLNLLTGERNQYFASREYFRHWMLDQEHRVRVGIRQKGADVEVHVCDPDGKNWRKVWAYRALSKDRVSPLGFGKNPNELYVLADHQGRRAVFVADLREANPKLELKVSDAHYDVEGSLVVSRKSGDAVGLLGTSRADKAQDTYWDSDRKELVAHIDLALPNRFNRIVSLSADESRYVVYSSSDTIPGQYFIGDDKAHTLELLASTSPGLDLNEMVAKESVTLKARDGLSLPAFLSLPRNAPAKQLPAVVLVHGGPQGHDTAGFDKWTQFLANRGYAVLQVNFRGSTGSGSQHMEAGLQRWGQEMQDDVTDATRWLIARGTADAQRICIVGASYGGYSALMGAAKTPDLYKCAMSFAGVSDLAELLAEEGQYVNAKEVAELQIGSRDKDRERLQANSPRYLAAQIKVPVLLLHGTQDLSVPYYQGQFMDAALTAAGKPHRFLTQERGDHHLSVYSHSLQFYTELEKFLVENIGKGAGQ